MRITISHIMTFSQQAYFDCGGWHLLWGNPHYPNIQIHWNVMSSSLDVLECNYSYVYFIHRDKNYLFFPYYP